MRVSGRLLKSKFSLKEKQIFLPLKGKFIQLLVRNVHDFFFYFTVNDVQLQLREKFRKIKGKQVGKSV